MTWDFRLDAGTRDLVPGYLTGPDEIMQRLITRLKRELGEWFLNTDAGLPWYGDAGGKINYRPERLATNGEQGILGSRMHTKSVVELLVRREALETEGVERVLRTNTIFSPSTRVFSMYLEVFIEGAGPVSLTLGLDSEGCINCTTAG